MVVGRGFSSSLCRSVLRLPEWLNSGQLASPRASDPISGVTCHDSCCSVGPTSQRGYVWEGEDQRGASWRLTVTSMDRRITVVSTLHLSLASYVLVTSCLALYLLSDIVRHFCTQCVSGTVLVAFTDMFNPHNNQCEANTFVPSRREENQSTER